MSLPSIRSTISSESTSDLFGGVIRILDLSNYIGDLPSLIIGLEIPRRGMSVEAEARNPPVWKTLSPKKHKPRDLMHPKRNTSSPSPVPCRVRWIFVLCIPLFFASCSTVSSKHNSRNVTDRGIGAARELERTANLLELPFLAVGAVAESTGALLQSAAKQEKKGLTNDAAGNYLKAAVDARNLIVANRNSSAGGPEHALFQVHNAALARFAEIWGNDIRSSEPAPYHLSSGGENYEIVLDSSSDYPAGFFDEAVASDAITAKGIREIERVGYGAALVGIRRKTPERAADMRFYAPKGLHLPVTLTIVSVEEAGSGESRRKLVSLALLDPTRRETVSVEGQTLPLAANFSDPVVMLVGGKNELLDGLFGFLNAKKRIEESGIYLLEPYDPNRIPVVLTHGLISVPIIWREIIPELLSEPDIASRYQILAFTYPSSYALPESGEFFRNELKAIREKYDPDGRAPLSRNMVAMGHSMGGVLSHMLVTDFDDRLWNEISDLPFDDFPVVEDNKSALRDLIFFEPDEAVQRAVYISAPHRGATMATLGVAGAVSQLVRLPGNLLASTADFIDGPPPEGLKVDIDKKVTSIQSLRPDAPVLLAMDKSPNKPGVVFHSIIGDRGKGDTPESSDGVVEYWSSHLDGAASELIVPTDHASYKDPKAIEELKRILRVHAGIL